MANQYTNLKTGRTVYVKSAEEVAEQAYTAAFKRQERNIEQLDRSPVWTRVAKAPTTGEGTPERRRVSAAGTLTADGKIR